MSLDLDYLWRTAAELPPMPLGVSGECRVTETLMPAGSSLPVDGENVAFPDGYRFVELSECGQPWMTSHPSEIFDLRIPLSRLRGRVLVGGLGLGIATHLLTLRGCECVTVERSADVIALTAPHVQGGGGVVQADLLEFVESIQPGQFDGAFLDIWREADQRDYEQIVVPLKRALAGKIDSVFCWRFG